MSQSPSEPSTTLNDFPVTWEQPSDATRSWTREDMHFPNAVPALVGDFATQVIFSGMNLRFEWANLPVRIHSRVFNGYIYEADELLIPENERKSFMQQMREYRRERSKVVRHYWDDEVMPTLREVYQWMRDLPIAGASPADSVQMWREAWQRMRYVFGLHFMVNAGAYPALDELVTLYESFTPGAQSSEALMLAQGQPHELQRVQRDIYALVQCARACPRVAELIVQDQANALAHITTVEGGAEFLAALDTFLNVHGHLGQAFEDISQPSWADEPALVLDEVRKRLRSPSEDPELVRQRLAAEADERVADVRERLREQPELLQQFDEAIALARDAGALTEDHNYWLDRMLLAHVYRLMLRVGKCLVEANVLADARDIFFLHRDEVAKALSNSQDLHDTVRARKARLEQRHRLHPPKHLGTIPETPPEPSRFGGSVPQQTESGVLHGTGACKGVARGPARVVLSQADFTKVQTGDVLVCPASNPTWVPLFGIIAGLVANTGGVLSHAAVVAREFGVPAVVGAGNATERIHDGQLLEVDGSVGVVRVLDE